MTKAEDVIRTIAAVISPMTYLLNKKFTNLDKKESKPKKGGKGPKGPKGPKGGKK
jgi:hypothetical protein